MLSAKKELFTPSGGAYQISRSVRLRNSATGYFSRTIGATATNAKIGTLSMWVKRGGLTSATGNSQYLIQTGISATTDSGHFTMYFTTSDNLSLGQYSWAGYSTTQVFRDPSAWYHIVLSYNSTLASNNLTIYVNGVQIAVTSVVQNTNWAILSGTEAINIGRHTSVGRSFDGYLTEINLIDGQALTPSSFGETNSVTGVWQPKKYAGTYGTNGFYLNFSDNSGATATTIGKDYSGNGNNWTPNNISVTAGVTYDSMLDVPTPYADGGTGRGNYAVGNPLAVNVTTSATATLTNGNLLLTNGSATYSGFPSTMSIPVTGKWAWKFKVTGSVSGSNEGYIGFACNSSGNPVTGASSGAAANWYTTVQVQAVSDRGVVHKYAGGSVVTDAAGSGGTGATGDEWEFLIDRDAGTTIVKVNGTTKATVTGLPATQELFPFATFYQTSGYFIFDYTPSDTSYKTLNTQNLPAPTISNGASYMAATTYTGTGSALTIANTVGSASFQPDLVWVKGRSGATDHAWYDAVRGVQNQLESNTTTAETTETTGLTAFGSTGFTVGALAQMNTNTATYVAWQWNAGGSTVTNTSGSISAQVRANPTAGFSVVTYTGNGTAGATVGHGLGVTPSMVIVKSRTGGTSSWAVWFTGFTGLEYILLESTAAKASASSVWNSTAPNSTVVTLGTGSVPNTNAWTYVMYCWAAVAGYSAFGKYTGNGSADGPFVFLGFRPRFVMIKRTDSSGFSWGILDTSRNTYNVANLRLFADLSQADNTQDILDILSNGFKLRTTNTNENASGGTYIYAAFSEVGFKYALGR